MVFRSIMVISSLHSGRNMCGIIGYKGNKDAANIVIEGLKRLEYRGYDSFGIATISEGKLLVHKQVGKVGDFSADQLQFGKTNAAIGHTRWATHGSVTQQNAHPHTSSDGRFAVVHNGILENFQQLRNELCEKYTFTTETDTEVIVRLIEEELKTKDIVGAVRSAFKKSEGRNAIVLLDSKTGNIIAARRGSPLIIGIGDDEYFVASDASAFIGTTHSALFLEDNECALVNDSLQVFDIETGWTKTKQIEQINWNEEQAKKGEYTHFMLKEICEQKFTIRQAIMQWEDKINEIAKDITNAFGTYAVGCGTAGKVCLAGTYFFSEIAKKHINFAFGSEFPSYHNFLKNASLLIAVSQSGETADTLEAIKTMKQRGGKVISIVNVNGSSIARASDKFLLVNCGPEMAVCSTKATTGQLAIMLLLAYACAGKYKEGQELLKKVADDAGKMVTTEFNTKIKALAQQIKKWESIYVIARGVNYPIALESAIKIQEVSYIHAEGFAGGELKHGPIALISKGTPCIVFIANDAVKREVLSNAMEVKSRGGFIIGISPENNEIFDVHIQVPDVGIASPIVNIIPIQLFAYYLAIEKNLDPDKPRNLAKSVTVC